MSTLICVHFGVVQETMSSIEWEIHLLTSKRGRSWIGSLVKPQLLKAGLNRLAETTLKQNVLPV